MNFWVRYYYRGLHWLMIWIVLGLLSIGLSHAASISGQITDENGQAIAGHYVSLYGWDGISLTNYDDFATDEKGNYHISDIPAGIYYLEYTDWGGPYLEQAYGSDMPLDIQCINYHTPISMSSDSHLSDFNSQLILGGTLSGRITDPDGNGIANVYVYVDRWSGSSFVQQASIPRTDEEGYYTAVGLAAGNYYLHVDKPDSPYLSQGYLDEIPFKWGTIDAKTAINISPGQNLEDVNIQLSLAGSISGRVTDTHGKGIANVYAYAYTWDGEAFREQASIPLSDAEGYYTIGGLVSNDYYLHFVPQNDRSYISQGYQNETPFTWGNIDYKTAIRVGAGQNFTDINIQLVAAASISGRVTDSNGNGISGVYAYAYTWDGDAFIEQASIPLSDENGDYTIPGLVSGDYFLHFVKPNSSYSSLGYPDEIPFQWGSIEGKQGIRLNTGQAVTDLDIQLVSGNSSAAPPDTHTPTATPQATPSASASVNTIVGNLFTVTPENVQLNTAGDRPKVENVLVMLTDEQSGATFERSSKTELILQEKTVAIFHPRIDEDSNANEPVTLVRGTIESLVNCNDYELRTSLAKILASDSCACVSHQTRNKRNGNEPIQFTANYQQTELDGRLTVNVTKGVVEIVDRDQQKTTVTAGQEKTIQNTVRRTAWVLPIDGDKLYAGISNKFVWTAYPDAVSYKLEYNLPEPIFAEENVEQEEFPTTIRIEEFTLYEDLVIFDIPIPSELNGQVIEARIFALDENGEVIPNSVSSDRFTVTVSD